MVPGARLLLEMTAERGIVHRDDVRHTECWGVGLWRLPPRVLRKAYGARKSVPGMDSALKTRKVELTVPEIGKIYGFLKMKA